MASRDYIPNDDYSFRTWAENFARALNEQRETYMVSERDVVELEAVVHSFVQAQLNADHPETRTTHAVADKNDRRAECERRCRQLAMLIKNNPSISDSDKIAAGVRPVNPERRAVKVPRSSPLLCYIGSRPGMIRLRYADTHSPDSGAKPFGASELQLFAAIGDEHDAPLSEAKFVGKFTRNPLDIGVQERESGRIATYYARWGSARGETGPWSVPVSFRIAA